MKPSLVVIGLGNPGAQYERTRHNVGFQALDVLSKEFGTGEWEEKDKFRALIQEARVVTVPVLLVKPLTYMNDSGDTVRRLKDFFKLEPSQFLVFTDDIDLPLGELRVRQNGGPGTHNGMKSIVEQLAEDFPRARIGLGAQKKGEDLATWVLSVPTKEETDTLRQVYQSLPEMLRTFVLGSSSQKK